MAYAVVVPSLLPANELRQADAFFRELSYAYDAHGLGRHKTVGGRKQPFVVETSM